MPYRIQTPSQAAWLNRDIRELTTEELRVTYLDPRGRVIDTVKVSEPGDDACAITCVPTIFTTAVRLDSQRMILVHNHIGVDTQPSQADLEMTIALRNAAKFWGMYVIDHVILAKGHRRWSFVEANNQAKTEDSHPKGCES